MTTTILPLKAKAVEEDIMKYLFLVYGRQKIGKTSLFAQWPDALFLSTEPGTKGLEIFEIQVTNWDTLLQAVKELEEEKRFTSVVIDTADRAYDMCLDYTCKKLRIPYPGTDDTGKNDYGKSWRAVRMEFLSAINRIVNTGRGVCFTSHAREYQVRSRSGETWDQISPTMSKQSRETIESIVDFFFFAEYVRDLQGNIRRILITEGDEIIWAGHRDGLGLSFPRFLPLLKKGGYDVILKAFQGEDVGLDPDELYPSKPTSKAGGKLLAKAKTPVKSQGATRKRGATPKKIAANKKPKGAARRKT